MQALNGETEVLGVTVAAGDLVGRRRLSESW